MTLLDASEISFTPYIPTTAFGLLALIAGYLYYYSRNKNNTRLEAIKNLPNEDKIKEVEMTLNDLGVRVDTTGMDSHEKLLLLEDMMKTKTKKSLIISAAIIIISLIVASIVFYQIKTDGAAAPKQDSITSIRFKLNYENAPKAIVFLQKSPEWKEPENIYVQNDGYFKETIKVPAINSNFLAKINPIVESSTLVSSIDSAVKISFIRTKKINNPDILTIIKCNKDRSLQLDDADPGCVELSSLYKPASESPFSFFSSAYAEVPVYQTKYSGWIVPNLNTLNKDLKTGFSQITLSGKSLPADLSSANRYSYTITVNGTLICVDGFLPEDIRLPFNYKDGFKLEFGLENLGFSGNQDGYERILVKLDFYKDSKLLKEIPCAFNYVALRSTESVMNITALEGTRFEWMAKYKSPAGLEYEIFWMSPPKVEAAQKGKGEIEKFAMTYQDKKVVGVIRPPKPPNPYYGVCVGVEQPNKQIKFTYSKEEANALLAFTKAHNKGAYLYRITGNQMISHQ